MTRRSTWRDAPPAGTRDARPLGPSLDVLAAGLGMAPTSLLGAVFARWEDLVGPDVAAHAAPRSVRNGVLTVVVDHPAWATSLRLLSADLLGRLREATGSDAVAELAVRVAPGR